MDRILKNQVIDLPADIENASQRKLVSTISNLRILFFKKSFM
ncbi:hypothetical protein LEP1GSC016_3179 [Leptospira borgpetersenii serovar Hardjo-bovis str. Sponselee]|uniref:Uncharacterized protein n=1 Tax=Leptospira borgpetersenii serovar Hardjo-bovis str. Sponselee TaxID=1303729 RepID=M6C5I1_LEPBO|nr:hypothetical protein LEP1GSC016_3179 [Leptospira borgpetersenii serovar Hardjo-bovis str. Sponselee]